MKKSILFLLIALAVFTAANANVIIAGRHATDGYPTFTTPVAGDTVRIPASLSPYSWFYVEDYHGTNVAPIVFESYDDIANGQPDSVVFTSDITFRNCSFVNWKGVTSGAQRYGFAVINTDQVNANSGVGINFQGLCTDMYVSNTVVKYKGFILWMKNESNTWLCDGSYVWPHRFYRITIDNVGGYKLYSDAMYIGSSSSENDYYHERPVECTTGVITYPRPTGLGWITVKNCYIEHANRQGIQWSGVDTGENFIQNNVIVDCGYDLDVAQGAGIAVGSSAYNTEISGNKISATYRQGIYSYGIGLVNVHDNDIDSSGTLRSGASTGGQYSIMINNFHNPPDRVFTRFWLWNNSLGKGTGADNGIQVLSTLDQFETTDNHIYNNSGKYGAVNLDVAPDVTYSTTAPPYVPPAAAQKFKNKIRKGSRLKFKLG